jgi:hypothetical protein
MSHRKINILNLNRIIYRRYPIKDKPSKTYSWGWYYENGTYECYDLFRTKAKITTYKSLKWHLLVIWYLNPKLTEDNFNEVCKIISNKSNGFVTFEINDSHLKQILYDIRMSDLDRPPKNKLRKIIFKDGCGLTPTEKLEIVGSIMGRTKKINVNDVYEAMLEINDAGEKITINKIAAVLKCSTRTIHRNINNELKKEKELLNSQI